MRWNPGNRNRTVLQVEGNHVQSPEVGLNVLQRTERGQESGSLDGVGGVQTRRWSVSEARLRTAG